ncbi:hypothetical protein B0O99DRAFT_692866 [Bisporella sp. PMI_857]|nr:hypothetical protein B0O99DRAFT_692866 [Bisporella sp. PMI_857]
MRGDGDPEVYQYPDPPGYPPYLGVSLELTNITHVPPSTKPPDVDVRPVELIETRPEKRGLSRLIGYKRGLVLYAAATGIILLFNIIWLIWARAKYGLDGDIGTISRGSCADSEALDSNLHLVINILSTIVLTASTKFMLIAYSPSRAEIDGAHERRRCLSVGSLGFRNLMAISWRKIIVYLLLMLTSSPFHLLSNSAVFLTLAANGYTWAVVSEQFVLDTNHTQPIISSSSPLSEEQGRIFTDIQSSLPTYDKLINNECVDAYADVYQSTRRTILIVAPNVSNRVAGQNVSQIFKFDRSFAGKRANNWICGKTQSDKDLPSDGLVNFDQCDPKGATILSLLSINSWQDWEVFNQTVLYCLSEKAEPPCSVQYSPTIVALLIVCNTLKLAGMILVLRYSELQNRPLSCPGDAVASFLEREDPTTLGMCLATRKGVKKLWANPRPKPYNGRPRRSWRGATRHRWLFFCASMFGILCGVLLLLAIVVSTARESSHKFHFFSNFGKVNTDLLPKGGGLAQASILDITASANLPQFILAIMWILYRDIYTSIAFARDWSRFEFQPQKLMVSRPRGQQRGVWFFSLPWAPAVFLLLMQMLLHFLISQSVFPVRIEAYDENGVIDPAHLVSNIGYSPVAMFVSLLVCVFLLWLLMWVGKQRMPSSAPIVGTCSAAISAACHPTRRTDGMANDYLRWGEVQTFEGTQRHCSMTAAIDFDVGWASVPMINVLYTGKG